MPRKNKKGNLTLYIITAMLGLVIIVVAGLLSPLGTLVNAEIYRAGEDLMLKANESISQIQNETVKTRIEAVMKTGLDATEDNIEINSNVYEYGWVFFLIIFFVVVFLSARQIKESGGRGFV